MTREGFEGLGLDGQAGTGVNRAGGELLDDGVVIAQFDPPYVLVLVVVQRVLITEGVATLPDLFPVVQLVGGPGLLGLVVEAELNATGGAEHVGLAPSVDAGLGIPLNLVDAGHVAVRPGSTMHPGHEVGGWGPVLKIQGQVNRTLVHLHMGEQLLGVVIHPCLEAFRAQGVYGVRGHLDLHVRADGIHLGVEVLHQEHKPEVRILELVLVAGVFADSPGVPTLPREIDDGARVVEQLDHTRADQPTVELADGIHATAQQTHLAQIDQAHGVRIEEQAPLRGFIEQRINSQQVFGHFPNLQ
ncbi:hypothetical protein D9M70_467740 [compost metagenome]